MHPHRSVLLTAAPALGLVLTQQACTPAGPPSGGATRQVTQAAAQTTPAGDAAIPAGRPVVIRPQQPADSIVAVDGNGRLALTRNAAEYGVFVLDPVGAEYRIRTARPDAGGRPACLVVKPDGTVVAAACDTGRDGQLFTIVRTADGYVIGSRGAYLHPAPDDAIVADEAPRATFTLTGSAPVS